MFLRPVHDFVSGFCYTDVSVTRISMPKKIPVHSARWMLPVLYFVAGISTIALVRTAPTTIAQNAAWLPLWQYVVLALFAGVMIFAILRRAQSRVLWEVLFTIAIFLGVWYVLLLLRIPLGVSLFAAALLTIMHLFIHIAAYHNFFFLLGSIGAAIIFSSWLPSEGVLIVLVAFTVYDMVAGPPGGPIERLAKRLVSLGFIPGFALPERVRGLALELDDIRNGGWVLLGTGDVILPLTLVASASVWSASSGAVVVLGTLFGSLILIARPDMHPRAALPPLAAGAAVPFLILLFSRVFIF